MNTTDELVAERQAIYMTTDRQVRGVQAAGHSATHEVRAWLHAQLPAEVAAVEQAVAAVQRTEHALTQAKAAPKPSGDTLARVIGEREREERINDAQAAAEQAPRDREAAERQLAAAERRLWMVAHQSEVAIVESMIDNGAEQTL